MIIACIGQKGGPGKSTVIINLGIEALRRRQRVKILDGDPQATVRTWAAVAEEAGRPAPVVEVMPPDVHRQAEDVHRGADLVLIDCPGRIDPITRAALLVADLALIPCGPSAADAWALASTIELLRAARQVEPDLKAAILINRKKGRTALGEGAREALAQGGLPILRTELGDRIAYQEALAAGMGVTTYAPGSRAAAEIVQLLDELRRKYR